MTDRETAIIVGASAGIGRALARELSADGYALGVAARRTERLERLADELPTETHVATMDVTETAAARERFDELADALDGVDVVVLSAGVGHHNRDLDWEPERETVDVNVRGFAALATVAMDHFADRGAGHLVGISSVAATFGNGAAPAYNASKAFVSSYVDGLRYWAADGDAEITVTDVRPGYVDTDLVVGEPFWMADPETAAAQIADAVRDEPRRAYVTRRWRPVAWLLRLLPDRAKERLFA